jgi:hypothetical protein
MYKLSFYVPESHLDPVKNALFAKGAGHHKACKYGVKVNSGLWQIANRNSVKFINWKKYLNTWWK